MEAQFKRQPTPKGEIRPDPHRWEAPPSPPADGAASSSNEKNGDGGGGQYLQQQATPKRSPLRFSARLQAVQG
ncbi:hypothetical protein BHE90_011425 [Fusarium euwallaceae]|uniref:Uncharacterized protein n=1 Tax=Fusarium euwallaceae TaxID=1147111 RepID=A0A430LEJ2_9HYPO|nr:hypothetical protein BHE90_011425 [Fusarium euwallaceae]